jgi:hypothetical protein
MTRALEDELFCKLIVELPYMNQLLTRRPEYYADGIRKISKLAILAADIHREEVHIHDHDIP